MPFDFEKNLTEKLGPLPGYAWVILGAGAVIWYRKKHPSTSVTSTSPAAPLDSSSTAATDPSLGLSNNAAWGSQAAQNLYGSSAYSPADITSAIDAYLNGSSLTSNQQGIINAAIAGLGNPPDNFGIDTSQTDSVTASSNQATIAASQEAIDAATAYADILTSTSDLGYQPDITPGYNNPPGFSGTAANDGPSGTALTTPTLPTASLGVTKVDAQGFTYLQPGQGAPSINPNLFDSAPAHVVPALSGTSAKGD